MSGPEAAGAQPAIHQMMAEMLRCRERFAPQFPQYAKRPVLPLTLSDEAPEADELYDAMRVIVNEVHCAYVQEYGAHCSWRRAGNEADLRPLLLQPHLQVFDAEPEDWTSLSALDYDEGPLRAAARAYWRETGWDHAPGPPSPDYVWVCVYKPRSGVYNEDDGELDYGGSLVGFAIVADRDGDEEPEALAHLWVARQARRAGHATLLLAEAERRFPALSTVERPVTQDGAAFLVASSPRLSAGLTRRA